MDQQLQKQQQSSSHKYKAVLLQFGEMPPLPHLVLAEKKQSCYPEPAAAHTEPGLQFGDMSPLVLSPGPSAPPKLPLVLPSSPVLPPSADSLDQKSPSSDEPVRPAELSEEEKMYILGRMLRDDTALGYPRKAVEAPAPTRKERRKLKQRANRAKGRREKAEKEKAQKESTEKENSEKENLEKENLESEKAEGENHTHTPDEDLALVAAPAQPKPSENPPFAAAPGHPEPSENSAPAVAPALTRKQRRKLKQRANRALGARERAEKKGHSHPSVNPPLAQPASLPTTRSKIQTGAGRSVHPSQDAVLHYHKACALASRGQLPPILQPPSLDCSFYPELRLFDIEVIPPPGAGFGKYQMSYYVPKVRYIAIKYLRPPGAPYTIPALFGPDPDGATAWYYGRSSGGKFMAAYPWISVGAGEAINPGFGTPGYHFPGWDEWSRVYNRGLRKGPVPVWPSEEEEEKPVGRTDEAAAEA